MTATLTISTEAARPGKVLVFACRWCSLLGAERAGRERLALPPDFRLIPVECAGAVPLDIILRAFADGASGIAVMGCHFGGCRHNESNRGAHARLEMLAAALAALGVHGERLLLSWGTAHEAHQFAELLGDFVQTLRDLEKESDLALLRGDFNGLKHLLEIVADREKNRTEQEARV